MQDKPKLVKKLDAIEVINSIMTPASNDRVTEWAKKLRKCATGASDAHIVKYLGKAVTASYSNSPEEFLENIFKKKNN